MMKPDSNGKHYYAPSTVLSARTNVNMIKTRKQLISKTHLPIMKSVMDLFFFVLCLIPSLILSYKNQQNPWTMFTLARANLSLGAEQILDYVVAASGYRAEHIGEEILQIGLINVTKWPVESIA